jgi:hypothetical protein
MNLTFPDPGSVSSLLSCSALPLFNSAEDCAEHLAPSTPAPACLALPARSKSREERSSTSKVYCVSLVTETVRHLRQSQNSSFLNTEASLSLCWTTFDG